MLKSSATSVERRDWDHVAIDDRMPMMELYLNWNFIMYRCYVEFRILLSRDDQINQVDYRYVKRLVMTY